MKRYIVKKVVFARNMQDAADKEKKFEPIEITLDEDVMEKEKVNKIGFETPIIYDNRGKQMVPKTR